MIQATMKASRNVTLRVVEIAERLGLPFEGDGGREISGAAPLETAGAGDLSFAGNRKAAAQAASSEAGCLIVFSDFNAAERTVIRSQNPRAAFAQALALLYPPRPHLPGIHPSAVIASTATIHPSCSIGPHTVIGEDVTLEANTVIDAGCFLGDGVTVGEGSRLHADVTIYSGVAVGARAILHSGCVLGADGFGFVLAGDHYDKFPQVGRVIIGDDVEIGANSCVDRAALGVTFIDDGTKLDNMVHVRHNCRIGKHVVIAAQTGLSGGVTIGDHAIVGGQVGIGDKARIESGAVLGSGCGVLTSKIIRSGQVVWGTPARPLREHLTQLASLSRLPELQAEIAELRRRLAELEQK
jgi:UDP-3-O-[3-hydroxymyristoyl] glucosamine N-acyltransferase